MTDMATYLAADAVAASLTHMIINLGLGLLGGSSRMDHHDGVATIFARVGTRRLIAAGFFN